MITLVCGERRAERDKLTERSIIYGLRYVYNGHGTINTRFVNGYIEFQKSHLAPILLETFGDAVLGLA